MTVCLCLRVCGKCMTERKHEKSRTKIGNQFHTMEERLRVNVMTHAMTKCYIQPHFMVWLSIFNHNYAFPSTHICYYTCIQVILHAFISSTILVFFIYFFFISFVQSNQMCREKEKRNSIAIEHMKSANCL